MSSSNDGAYRAPAGPAPSPRLPGTGTSESGPAAARPPVTTETTAPVRQTAAPLFTSQATTPTEVRSGSDRREVLDRQKQQFGGIRWGSAFFGWLTAIGTAVLLTGIVAAIGGALGLTVTDGGTQAAAQAGQAAQNPATAQTAGIVSAVVTLVVLLIAYYCGGYVAGRMARFNGMKQGIAVWVWTIAIAIVVAGLIALAGAQVDVLGSIGGLPQLPISGQALTTAAILSAVAALVVSLIGAILGGLAGMRYHRKIDRAGFEQ